MECTVEGCTTVTKRNRRLCSAHQHRKRRYGDPLGKPATKTPQERFWEKVDKTGECWLWQGYISHNGYGRFAPSDTIYQAHRLAYEWCVGPIPEGIQIDHICHVRNCVNPEHLRLATVKQQKENILPLRNNTSGYRGVHRRPNGKWKAQVNHNKVAYVVGYYDTPEEAAEAAKTKRQELFTHCDD